MSVMTRTNMPNECTSTSAAIATACTSWTARYASRGPRRSATRPTGTPAARPTSAATPMPRPTCVTDRPTERVKNSAAPVMKRPLPIVLTNVATASVRRGPRSGSSPFPTCQVFMPDPPPRGPHGRPETVHVGPPAAEAVPTW